MPGPSHSSTPSEVPGWLLVPPSALEEPPVETRHQVLPFEKLTWENFERLCLRLAGLESEVEHCQLYGTRGQEQDGIDLYARYRDGSGYAVYQCKRVAELTAGDLRAAVTRFKDGTWAGSARRLVLCTSRASVRTQLASEIEAQAQQLRPIEFAVWDSEELSRILKALPEIVDEFFSREWVRVFCGEAAASSLGDRLDGRRVAEFRERLGRFYASFFESQDPLSQRLADQRIRVVEHFVVPNVTFFSSLRSQQPGPPGSTPRLAEEGPSEVGTPRPPATARVGRSQTTDTLTAWLHNKSRAALVGAAGAGKSTVLRFLAEQILSDSPAADPVRVIGFDRLPVWVSFAFWTKAIEGGPPSAGALLECIRTWLDVWGQGDLWPLVMAALKDKRLLLLVDGLDEWASDASARLATHQLMVFVETHDVHAIATSRGEGFRRLPLQGRGWETAELAPLSDSQVREICERWFERRQSSIAGGEADARSPHENASRRAAQFLSELEQRPELQELSRNGLMLVLLLFLRMQHAALPRRRFEVYRSLVEHLIREHPEVNLTAASITTLGRPLLTEREQTDALASLAFRLQRDCLAGVASAELLEEAAREYLADETYGRGMDPRESVSAASGLIDLASRKLGLLVRQGGSDFAFFHRSIQEHLAASHISRLEPNEQLELLRQHSSDPRWREVVLGVLWLVQRPNDLRSMIGVIQELGRSPCVGAYAARELLAEVAFGEFSCPPTVTRDLKHDVFNALALDGWLAHRRRLLSLVVDGLKSPTHRDDVARKLRLLIVERGWGRDSAFDAMRAWPFDEITADTCRIALRGDDAGVQRSAAMALISGEGRNGKALSILLSEANRSPHPYGRAAAVRALALGERPELSNEPATRATDSSLPEMRLAAIISRVKNGQRNEDDLAAVLEMSGDMRLDIEYSWRTDLASMLVEGWTGSERLRRAVLSSLSGPRHIEPDIATAVLLHAFVGDRDATDYCERQLRHEKYAFLSLMHGGAFEALTTRWATVPGIPEALEAWVARQEKPSIHMIELASVARVVRSDLVKRALLDSVKSTWAPQWAALALLEHWGEDADARAALVESATAPETAYSLAHLFPRIFPPDEARRRLLDLLQAPSPPRLGPLVRGLSQLAVSDTTTIGRCLEAADGLSGLYRDDAKNQLVRSYPSDGRVRSLCSSLLRGRQPPYAAAAQAYGNDEEMRRSIAELLAPLPRRLRIHAIEEARGRSVSSAAMAEFLRDYDCERENEIKTLGSWQYHLTLTPDARAAALPAVRESLTALGPDMEARREAAVAALLAMDRLDVLEAATEPSRPNDPVVVRSFAAVHGNSALARALAERWGSLSPSHRSLLRARLQLEDDNAFWTLICEVSDNVYQVHAEVLARLDAMPALAVQPEPIRFLASVAPGSDALRERALHALSTRGGRGGVTWEQVGHLHRVARIVARSFGGRSDVFHALMPDADSALEFPGRLAALCLGWPQEPGVQALYARAATLGDALERLGTYSLAYACTPAPVLVDVFRGHMSTVRLPRVEFPVIADHLVRRVEWDSAARNALKVAMMAPDAKPNLKATFSRVLAAAGAMTPEEYEWARREAETQIKAEFPDVGFDLIAERTRSLASCLLDVLGQ